MNIFDNPEAFDGCRSDLSIDGIKHAVCRGGWPGSLNKKTERAQLAIAKDLFTQTCEVDISKIDDVKRNPVWASTILRSYSRNLCTLAEAKTILADAPAWNPSIRSKTSIRSSKKRNYFYLNVCVYVI